jgi:hypothetical protein
MGDVRASQLVAESVTAGDADLSVSQLVVEAITPSLSIVRASQILVETITSQPFYPPIRYENIDPTDRTVARIDTMRGTVRIREPRPVPAWPRVRR